MKIAINTLAINRKDFGGGETYLYQLLRNLAKIDKENQYFVFVSQQNQDRFTIDQPNFKTIICPVNQSKFKRILYEQLILPKLIRKYKIDVFHGPNNLLPLRVPCKSVVTVQFMINFVFPNYFSPIYRRWYFNILMRLTTRKANKVISVSHNTKREIVKYLKVKKENITVVHNGVDEFFLPVYREDILLECKQRWGIENQYILCVANNVPNKNLERLIYAFNYLKGKYKIPHQLILVGSLDLAKGEKERLLTAFKKAKNLNDKTVIFTGYVEHIDIPLLYSGADVFALPSFCESCNIPLLEAMKCGVPVVTSNVSVMPEVVGNAALKINPYDFREIGEAIYALLKDERLKKGLIEKGLKRAKDFSWEKTAKAVLAVYESCLYGEQYNENTSY